MKTLSNHIQKIFKPAQERQRVKENQIDNQKEIVNKDESAEKEKLFE